MDDALLDQLMSFQPDDKTPSVFRHLLSLYSTYDSLVYNYAALILQYPDVYGNGTEETSALESLYLIFCMDDLPPNFLSNLLTQLDDDTFSDLMHNFIISLGSYVKKHRHNTHRLVEVFSRMHALVSPRVAPFFLGYSDFLTTCLCFGLPIDLFVESVVLMGPRVPSEDWTYIRDLIPVSDITTPDAPYDAVDISPLYRCVHRLLLHMVKQDTNTCKALFISSIIGLLTAHAGRSKLQEAIESKKASDAILYNLYFVLLLFCEPFLSKPEKLDIIPNDLLESNDLTSVAGSSFVEECFGLALETFRLLFTALFSRLGELDRYYGRILEAYNGADAVRKQPISACLKDMISLRTYWLQCYRHDVFLLLHSRLINFAVYKNPRNEDILKLIIDYFSFLLKYVFNKAITTRWMSEKLDEDRLNSIFASKSPYADNLPILCPDVFSKAIHWLSIPISNPYFKGQVIELLFHLVYLSRLNPKVEQVFIPCLFGEVFKGYGVQEEFVPESKFLTGILKYYISIEKMDTSSGFYDKLNYRYRIHNILNFFLSKNSIFWKNVPSNSWYSWRRGLVLAVKPLSLEFGNDFLNDFTYLFDEATSKLKSIYNIERGAEGDLSTSKRIFKGSLPLLEEMLTLFNTFVETRQLQNVFLQLELRNRTADILDYHLVQLFDKEINIRCKDDVNFKPKNILASVLKLYCQFSERPSFIRAVAEDSRSYQQDIFKNAQTRLSSFVGQSLGIYLSQGDLERWELMIKRIESQKSDLTYAEEDLDVPDEFLDPIMSSVMTDPVRLTTSNVIVDRATILKHLLNDKSDPFNRTPITEPEKQIIPETELKQRINAFLAEKKNKK